MRAVPAALFALTLLVGGSLVAQQLTIDLANEPVGRPPTVFEPEIGNWVVVQDGPEKVIKVDGAAYKASLDAPAQLMLDNARKLYGATDEELLDHAKQFTTFPVAVLKSVSSFSNGTISVKFKTISGDADRASGILFNLKPNGDWLCVRYNDTEHNVILWEFHNGIRRALIPPLDGVLLTAEGDLAKWHDLTLAVNGAKLSASLDGAPVMQYTLGSPPGPGRDGAAPNRDLIPANNPVIRPPVSGRVGLWSKSDSTVEFKDYVVRR